MFWGRARGRSGGEREGGAGGRVGAESPRPFTPKPRKQPFPKPKLRNAPDFVLFGKAIAWLGLPLAKGESYPRSPHGQSFFRSEACRQEIAPRAPPKCFFFRLSGKFQQGRLAFCMALFVRFSVAGGMVYAPATGESTCRHCKMCGKNPLYACPFKKSMIRLNRRLSRGNMARALKVLAWPRFLPKLHRTESTKHISAAHTNKPTAHLNCT